MKKMGESNKDGPGDGGYWIFKYMGECGCGRSLSFLIRLCVVDYLRVLLAQEFPGLGSLSG